MKYPRMNNCLVISRVGEDEYEARDCLREEEYILDGVTTDFLRQLDGKTDPYRIYPDWTRNEIKELMDDLDENGLLRRKRVLTSSIGSIFFTLWIPQWGILSRFFAGVFNKLLLFSWLPVLIAGLLCLRMKAFDFTADYLLVGYFAGLIVGMFLHELAHAFAGVSYGGHMFEMGVMTQFFIMFGAYVLIDTKDVKNRMRKAQIHAAGVEMNLLLAGVFFILMTSVYPFSGFFYGAAMVNLILGAANLTFARGLDGLSIMADIFGEEDIIGRAKELLKNKRKRQMLKRRGLTGSVTVAVCRLIVSLRLVMPLIIFVNIIEVLLWAV